MLKQILTLLCFLSLLCTSVRAQKNTNESETPVTSKITNATVFLEGAQVSRAAKTEVPAGRATLVFTGLTPDMDPQSIQVKADNKDFIILAVSHRLNFNERPRENPETDKLYDRIDALDDRASLLTTRYQIAKEEENILKENRVVAGTNGLNADELRKTVAFQRERITAIRMLYLAIGDSLDMLKEERELIQEQLSEAGNKRQSKTTAEIVVVTNAVRPVSSDFTVTYLTASARWAPHYDIRVADISQPVDLRYRAKVSQESGEDWTNVRLKLSSGDPTTATTAPTLEVWRAYPGSRPPSYQARKRNIASFSFRKIEGRIVDVNGEPLIGAVIIVPGTEIGVSTDMEGYYSLEAPASTRELIVRYVGFMDKTHSLTVGTNEVVLEESDVALSEVVVSQLSGRAAGVQMRGASSKRKKDRRKGSMPKASMREDAPAPVPVNTERRATTVVFDIELPYTIPSDGKARDVEIKQHDLPATYSYFAVPKFSPDAFLKATVTNWDQYDLLNGQAQLFFEGTYLGTTALNVSNTNDTLELSLGRDAGVLVERKETDEYRKRNFFGGKVTESRGYTIAVRNKKGQTIDLTVLDQVPVSADEAVDVKPDLPAGVSHAEKTGILSWKVNLAPGTERKMNFGYTVKSPKNGRVMLE